MFLFSNPSWKTFALENLLGLKLLHDRGFNVGGVGEIIEGFLGRFLDIMFGEGNVTWEKMNIEPPPEMAQIDEDSEEHFILQEFYDRSHYDVKIRVPGLAEVTKNSEAKNSLLSILQKLVPSRNDYIDGVFPWWELFVSISWLEENAELTGIHIHFVDVMESCCDDEPPVSLIHYIRVFVEFWDRLQLFKNEVRKSA